MYKSEKKNNSRFASYCPYCQIASDPSSNPLPQGLRDPPSYETATSTASVIKNVKAPCTEQDQQQQQQQEGEGEEGAQPPPYTTTTTTNLQDTTEPPAPPADTLHFVHPAEDTIPTLSIRYGVPAHALRQHNRLASDHLLAARRAVLIPSPRTTPRGRVAAARGPVAGGEEEEAEEEARRLMSVRRWMVACRCADYGVAELYLGRGRGGYDDDDVDGAVGRFLDDERWEGEHPLHGVGGEGKGKDEGKRSGGGLWAGLRKRF